MTVRPWPAGDSRVPVLASESAAVEKWGRTWVHFCAGCNRQKSTQKTITVVRFGPSSLAASKFERAVTDVINVDHCPPDLETSGV
jgi:hypothetical protein